MFRLWGKIVKDHHILDDMTVENGNYALSDEELVRDAIDRMCVRFDLSHPIWLAKNRKEFAARHRTRFAADSFLDPISFDYLEIQMLDDINMP